MNDYEAHLSSYDHSHKQRLKDMKAMVRDPNAGAKARKAEAKADGIVSIKLLDQDVPSSALSAGGASGGGGGSSSGGGGFKKSGFKKTGFKSAFAPAEPAASADAPQTAPTDAPHTLADQRSGGLVETGEAASTLPLAYKSSLVESDTEDEGYELYDPRFPTD